MTSETILHFQLRDSLGNETDDYDDDDNEEKEEETASEDPLVRHGATRCFSLVRSDVRCSLSALC